MGLYYCYLSCLFFKRNLKSKQESESWHCFAYSKYFFGYSGSEDISFSNGMSKLWEANAYYTSVEPYNLYQRIFIRCWKLLKMYFTTTLHYNLYSWTDHTKTFHDPFWSDLIDFSFIASGANYITDTRQRINRHLADKDQWNLVGCPLDRDFSSGYRHLNFKRKARFTSLGEFEEFSLHTSPKSEIDEGRSVRLGQFHISISLANHRSPL